MKYTYIQREYSEPFITIGEYIFETDPETFTLLCTTYLGISGFVQEGQKLIKAFTAFCQKIQDISDELIEKLMQEPPKLGRGGLLPGEREDVLYD